MPEGNIKPKLPGEVQREQLERIDQADLNDMQESTEANIAMDQQFYAGDHANEDIDMAEIHRNQS